MSILHRFVRLSILLLAMLASLQTPLTAADAARRVPDPLKPWEEWAMWSGDFRGCPTPYDDGRKYLSYWPSQFALIVDHASGRFTLDLTVFHESWVILPGSRDLWPFEVKSNGAAIPVLERAGAPAVHLNAGHYHLDGVYRWDEMPQRIAIPREIGIVTVTLEGKKIEAPAWDAEGFLWLKRTQSDEKERNFLSVKVYRDIEDGIPMWLQTELELSVSGKSREEVLGSILPEGWQLSSVESPIPVAVDEKGMIKAQVRAGKWTVHLVAFRLSHAATFNYAEGIKPIVSEELVAFRAAPDFRMVEVRDVPSIDVSQTTFPAGWRSLPVYRWENSIPFHLEERMRGMGQQKPDPLSIQRELWLDESGKGFTFRDNISGRAQQIWRLDVAETQKLGAVRSNGEGQLITRNPATGALGVEIRSRDINLEATGRIDRAGELSATGWRSDANGLNVSLNLPPGWRLFALFGADSVSGDWLTAWSLLDLFLLLVFTLAVYKLWGLWPCVLSFFAFALSYQEPGAPRFAWLVLLATLALVRFGPAAGFGSWVLRSLKYIAVLALICLLVPFVTQQIQQAIYPQLEANRTYGERVREVFSTINYKLDMAQAGGDSTGLADSAPQARAQAEMAPPPLAGGQVQMAAKSAQRADSTKSFSNTWSGGEPKERQQQNQLRKSNLFYDSKARIQTGPAVPDWNWRRVTFSWSSPVQASQQVRLILIPMTLERVLTVLRIALLLLLAGVLLDARRWHWPLLKSWNGRGVTKVSALLAFLFVFTNIPQASAQQFPDAQTLQTLHDRLLEPSDAFPNAADIANVSLALRDKHLTLDAEIHVAARCAVPLPGRLPAWSPVSVTVDGQPEAALRRDDGYLWVVLGEGVHRVRVEGSLATVTEWEWTFRLKPRHVTIDAPGWTVTGVRPNGIPEQQIFFALIQKSTTGEASYDQQDFQPIVSIDRNIELGLIWQVHNVVTRLSPIGKAVSLRVPLLPGESVISSSDIVKDGHIEVRLGALERTFEWESELPVAEKFPLVTSAADNWVEHWHLVASPVWNVSLSGLAPVFEQGADLVPVWHPWPGEKVELTVNRPEAVSGATVTVRSASYEVGLGRRQRNGRLNLNLQCSIGEDFVLTLPRGAEITTLLQNGRSIPVRQDGDKLVVPLRPGEENIGINWKLNTPLGFVSRMDAVQLPVEAANITSTINAPESRWILWTSGPLRGPAVRLWGVLACALLVAWILGRLELSPLRSSEWMLLAIGLTQLPLPAALLVVGWFFVFVWRGSQSFQKTPNKLYLLAQLILAAFTLIVTGIFVTMIGKGLLGWPEMFITGNGSYAGLLRWYQDRCDGNLPQPLVVSVSIWWYRLFVLAWALWLATAFIRWSKWGWTQFSAGGLNRPFWNWRKKSVPPPLPVQ